MKTRIPPLTKCQTLAQTIRAATPFPDGCLRGPVMMDEASRDLLYLRAQETRKKLFIHWTPDTQFAVDGHPGSSADLRSGQRVQIHCRIANEELKADDITLSFRAMPACQSPRCSLRIWSRGPTNAAAKPESISGMSASLRLTPANVSLNGGAKLGRPVPKPAAKTGSQRAASANWVALPLAKVSRPAGTRFHVRSGAHAADDISSPPPSHQPTINPGSPPSAIDAIKPDGAKDLSPPEKKTILIADDEIHVRESLAAVLRQENYAVRLAENGRVAVREFLADPTDLNMPDTDGWKAFNVIARLAPDVPVIVITARPGQARRAAEAGIDMLLEKPLDIPVLLETIRALLASPQKSNFARVLRAWSTNDQPGSQG
jgi:CheY-like chemotaxis protein